MLAHLKIQQYKNTKNYLNPHLSFEIGLRNRLELPSSVSREPSSLGAVVQHKTLIIISKIEY